MMPRYQQRSDVVTRRLAGETLLIPITQVGVDLQKVYLLSETAAAVWALLAEPLDLDALVARLGDEYEAPADEMHRDVADTVREFADRGFVQTVDADV